MLLMCSSIYALRYWIASSDGVYLLAYCKITTTKYKRVLIAIAIEMIHAGAVIGFLSLGALT
jgi:hypothetical protein